MERGLRSLGENLCREDEYAEKEKAESELTLPDTENV